MTTQQVSLRYTGKGVDILGHVILGGFLMIITLGLYTPWYVNSLTRYICEHVQVVNPAPGTTTSVEFIGSGSGLLGRFILWQILVIITLGLYSPWMMSEMYAYIVENIRIQVRST